MHHNHARHNIYAQDQAHMPTQQRSQTSPSNPPHTSRSCRDGRSCKPTALLNRRSSPHASATQGSKSGDSAPHPSGAAGGGAVAAPGSSKSSSITGSSFFTGVLSLRSAASPSFCFSWASFSRFPALCVVCVWYSDQQHKHFGRVQRCGASFGMQKTAAVHYFVCNDCF